MRSYLRASATLIEPVLGEGAAGVAEDLCHVGVTGSVDLALCGVRINADEAPHAGEIVNNICTGCGRKICLTCESLNDRELLLLGR